MLPKTVNVVPSLNAHGRYADQRWLFTFGAYGETLVLVRAQAFEDALETAAEWLAEHAPGHLNTEDEMEELYQEACEEAGLPWPPPCTDDVAEARGYNDARESVEADLTYTESGYLASHEWWAIECEREDIDEHVAAGEWRMVVAA